MPQKLLFLSSVILLLFANSILAEAPPVLSISGMVKQPLNLNLRDLERLQSVHVRLNEVGMNGDFHGAFEYCGVPLRTILDLAGIQKEATGFLKPIDLAILIRTRNGKQALLSWGEVFYRNPADVVVTLSAVPIMPAKNCQDCHTPDVYQPRLNQLKRRIIFPKLVTANDFYTDRCLEDLVNIEVVDVHPKIAAKKSSSLFSPAFSISGSVKHKIDISDLSSYPHAEVPAKQVGEGKGYHGLKRFAGVPLTDLLNKAGVDTDFNTCVIVSAPDRYRSLFSYGELFMASSGKEIIVADRMAGQPLKAHGKFMLIAPHDLSADRWVKAVDKIEVIRLQLR